MKTWLQSCKEFDGRQLFSEQVYASKVSEQVNAEYTFPYMFLFIKVYVHLVKEFVGKLGSTAIAYGTSLEVGKC